MTSIATIALVALAGFLLEGNGMEESLLKVTFIGLAALQSAYVIGRPLSKDKNYKLLKEPQVYFLIEYPKTPISIRYILFTRNL
ncbi:MAG: hypothetical protein CM15mP62_20230 [Rhodospirillaceae bacterium]|nr:MAG: hypothetical protein CM15mP62_20230 [Rhodospirillaceae bacterium]